MQKTRIISRALWASLMILCLICPSHGYAKDKPGSQRAMRVVLHVQPEHIDSVLPRLQKRLEEAGIENPTVEKMGDESVSIKLPGIHDIQHIRRLVEQRGLVQWILVDEDLLQRPAFAPEQLQKMYDEAVRRLEDEYEGKTDKPAGRSAWTFEELDAELHSGDLVPDNVILRIWERKDPTTGEVEKITLLLRSTPEDPEVLTGDQLVPEKIKVSTDDRMQPVVEFEMNPEAAKRFGEITREYNANTENAIAAAVDRTRGWRIAILVDNKVICAPAIMAEILHGKGVISGLSNEAEAKDLAAMLKSGSLPVKPTITRIHYVLKETKKTGDKQSDE